MLDRIQVRRDTAANWTVANPTLTAGEFGFETDTGFIKIGNGTTVWNSLLYVGGASVVSVNGDTGVVVLTTSDISEGTNKYYTNTRVASYLTAPGPIGATTPNAGSFTTGDFSGNIGHIRGIPYVWPNAQGAASTFLGDDGFGNLSWSLPHGDVFSVNTYTGVVSLTTSDIPEGSNLYYTDARVDTVLTAPGPIGSVTPNSGAFTTGTFSGNISHIRSIAYNWPLIQGGMGSFLGNDGMGGLSWSNPVPTGTPHAAAVFNGSGVLTSSTVLDGATGLPSIDIANHILYDHTGIVVSVDIENRYLKDSLGFNAILWDQRLATDSGQNTVIDWDIPNGGGFLADSPFGFTSLDWNVREAYDSLGRFSVLWDARKLVADDGLANIFDWSDPTKVVFGTGTPKANIKATGVIQFASMTTMQRDGLTPQAGDTIFNTTTVALETYDGTLWV